MSKTKTRLIGLAITFFACMGLAVSTPDAAVSTPTKVTATSKDAISVSISYKKISGVTGYQIYRATSKSGKYKLIKTNKSSKTVTYTDTKLTSGKKYYYKVRAYKTVKKKNTYSKYSSVVSATPIAKTPKVTVSNETYNSLRISYGKQSNISGYTIYRATSKSGKYTAIKNTSNTQYSDVKLTPDKKYYYKVRAYRTVSGKKVYGKYSSVVSGTPKLFTPKVVVAAGVDSITVINTKVSQATGYEIYRATSKSGKYTKVHSGNELMYNDTSITLDKTYYYKVRAYVESNGKKYYSSYSSVLSATVFDLSYIIDLNAVMTEFEALKAEDYINYNDAREVYIREADTKSEITKKTKDLRAAMDKLILDFNDVMAEQTKTFKETYYNKQSNTTLSTVDDAVYYVDLGKYTGTTDKESLESLKVNDNTYTKDGKIKVSIGQNAFIDVAAWKISDEGNVLVSLPVLALDTLPGQNTTVTVDSQVIKIQIYKESVEGNNLELTEAKEALPNEEYASEVTTTEGNNVTYRYTHRATALGLILSLKDTAILDENTLIFVRNSDDNKIGVTIPEDGVTVGIYPDYANSKVEESKTTTRSSRIAIPGKGVIDVNFTFKAVNLLDKVSELTEKTKSFKTTYYNQKPNQKVTADQLNGDNNYYMELGDYKGTDKNQVTELTMNGNTYGTENTSVSIGNNGFIEAPVWKISDQNKVLVAIPYLASDALPGQETYITVGGQEIYVKLYNDSVEENVLTLSDATALNPKEGYKSEAKITGENEVEFTYTHRTSALGLTLKLGDEVVKGDDLLIFRKSGKNMGVTTTEKDVTYGIYPDYANEPVTETKTTDHVYRLAIPGKGVIEVNVTFNAVKTDYIKTITDQTQTFKTTYYDQKENQVLTADDIDDSIYYVDLGEYTGSENPTTLKINENEYNQTNGSISIGKHGYIEAPIWKISEEGNVLVALPWLASDALPGNTSKVTVGGQEISLILYESDLTHNTLKIDKAASVFDKDGYTGTATHSSDSNKVTYTYTHRATALGITLKLDETEIKGENLLIFRKSAPYTMGVTTTEAEYTYVAFPDYANAAVTEAKTNTYTSRLAIPGKGVIEIELEFIAKVKDAEA